ncbi:hypothetical protein CXB51_016567 [Gossypium anomalum]|uniref:DDE Tnp4 domain-containing protein n=1 Tax=Gossypium anomalum TaxID=47600 RepID=A0A8J5YQX4_9ROSI|nr:hypothetical protein CXB51_016567 [Gossypium anomalum]
MARLPLIVQNERRKRIGLAITIWLQMCTVANWFLVALGAIHSLHTYRPMIRSYILDFYAKRDYVKRLVYASDETCIEQAEPITANSTDPRWKWFKNCLGALDGTHIKIRVPTVDKPRYRTRKGDIATNMLGVCAPDMQFVYVLPGWKGSVADGRVLRDAISRRHGLKVPHGCYYLVDAGYTNCEGFLAPFRGQRYHLNEWRQGYQPSTPEEFFNMKHASARNVIERCFGLLKLRWGILRSPSFYPSSRGTKRKWVPEEDAALVACMVDLHNFGTFNADTGFKAGYLNELEKMIEKVLPNAMLKAKPNLESRIRTLKSDWSIVYDMLSGKNNSGFGWDEHRQLVVAEDAVWNSYISVRIISNRATGKDAQTAADIIEEINVEDVAATNSHEERNDFHGSEADVSLDDMDLQLHNLN